MAQARPASCASALPLVPCCQQVGRHGWQPTERRCSPIAPTPRCHHLPCRAIQVLGMSCALAGFILIFVAVQQATGTSVSTYTVHRRLGISAMSMGFFQLFALVLRCGAARQRARRLRSLNRSPRQRCPHRAAVGTASGCHSSVSKAAPALLPRGMRLMSGVTVPAGRTRAPGCASIGSRCTTGWAGQLPWLRWQISTSEWATGAQMACGRPRWWDPLQQAAAVHRWHRHSGPSPGPAGASSTCMMWAPGLSPPIPSSLV